jgi:hypothetical protein
VHRLDRLRGLPVPARRPGGTGPREEELLQGRARLEGRPLIQHAHGEAAPPPDDAGIRLEAAREDAEEGRLAAAVAPDEADAIARVDAERRVGEEGGLAQGHRNSVEGDEVHVGANIPRAGSEAQSPRKDGIGRVGAY